LFYADPRVLVSAKTKPLSANRVAPCGLLEIKWIQKPFKYAATCKIHIKCFASPKIANFISLESLKSVEPNFAETSHGY
jgi:hypothetical protein